MGCHGNEFKSYPVTRVQNNRFNLHGLDRFAICGYHGQVVLVDGELHGARVGANVNEPKSVSAILFHTELGDRNSRGISGDWNALSIDEKRFDQVPAVGMQILADPFRRDGVGPVVDDDDVVGQIKVV